MGQKNNNNKKGWLGTKPFHSSIALFIYLLFICLRDTYVKRRAWAPSCGRNGHSAWVGLEKKKHACAKTTFVQSTSGGVTD